MRQSTTKSVKLRKGFVSKQPTIAARYADGRLSPDEFLAAKVDVTTSLHNALCGVNDAVVVLDHDLHIVFFVPATLQVFRVLATDLGRPLSDLRALTDDPALFDDARNVLASGAPVAKEVQTTGGRWFSRRLLPNLDASQTIIGVILIYSDVSEQHEVTVKLETAIAAASSVGSEIRTRLIDLNHDLRQPLQNLLFLHSRLWQFADSPDARQLLDQFDATLATMTAQLNALPFADPAMDVDAPRGPPGGIVDRVGIYSQQKIASDLSSQTRHQRLGTILLVEDNDDLRGTLASGLRNSGFDIVAAANAAAALEAVDQGAIQPDVILVDYNLSGGVDGLVLGNTIRIKLRRDISLVVLTGNVSSTAVDILRSADCVCLMKPVRMQDLIQCLATIMSSATDNPVATLTRHRALQTICIVDDEPQTRSAIRAMLEEEGYQVTAFADAEAFLAANLDPWDLCLLLDVKLPGLSGIELLARMHADDVLPPAIVLTAVQEPQETVRALKVGALDFLIKPVPRRDLLAAIERVVAQSTGSEHPGRLRQRARILIGQLTERQLQVMALILAGLPNKIIAADLGVSQRTVENHRAAIMHRTGARSLPELARLSIAAELAPSA